MNNPNNLVVPTLANQHTIPTNYILIIQGFGGLAKILMRVPINEAIVVFKIIGSIVDKMMRIQLEAATCPNGGQGGRINQLIQDVINEWQLYHNVPAWRNRSPTWGAINPSGVLFLLMRSRANIDAAWQTTHIVNHLGNSLSGGEVWLVRELIQADRTGAFRQRYEGYVINQPKYHVPEDLPDPVEHRHYRRSIEALNHDGTLLGMKELLEEYATEVSPDREGIMHTMALYLCLGRLAAWAWRERLTKAPSLQDDPIFPSKLKTHIDHMAKFLNRWFQNWQSSTPRQYRTAMSNQDLATDFVILLNHAFHTQIAKPGTILSEEDLKDIEMKYSFYMVDRALDEECDWYGFVKEVLGTKEFWEKAKLPMNNEVEIWIATILSFIINVSASDFNTQLLAHMRPMYKNKVSLPPSRLFCRELQLMVYKTINTPALLSKAYTTGYTHKGSRFD